MTCDEVRSRLVAFQRGRLSASEAADVGAHLEACHACAHAGAVEQELTSVLERRLPAHPASFALKRRIAAQVETPRTLPRARWRASLVPLLVAASVVLVAVPAVYYQRATSRDARTGGMVAEAVNDYLRIVASQHPLDVESGGLHQVKPWFEGRLDFAPVVTFEGDADFPLRGGAVGYFMDRKAAVFVYARRLHAISLLVFRAEGLPWPAAADEARALSDRGVNVVLWRRDALGYALVSDVDARDLAALAAKLGAPAPD